MIIALGLAVLCIHVDFCSSLFLFVLVVRYADANGVWWLCVGFGRLLRESYLNPCFLGSIFSWLHKILWLSRRILIN
uniref:Uncharacterized protein n=1 Tax=Oryza brachyantha TaxID=4533 RepID=J3LAW8_ORYBR